MPFDVRKVLIMCSLACSGTHCVDCAGPKLTEIHLALPPKCEIKGVRQDA